MLVFIDRTQFLLIPTIGLVFESDGIFLTFSFMIYGISVRLKKR
jgi:hypothetical protein